ncbi:MAG: thiol oxidoreductase [Rhodospirillaceae bacterium]|nr:thiol oxidoreductase [Rhodospirillaceae bacterium]
MAHRWLIALISAAALTAGVAHAERTLREQLLAAPLSDQLGGATTRPVATKDAFTFVAGNASDQHKARFVRGNELFTATWDPTPGKNPNTQGLGPLFNAKSCFDCHIQNGRGTPPTKPHDVLDSSLVRISVPGADPNGGPNPVPIYGDQLQDKAIDGVPPEATPNVRWREVVKGKFADGTHYSLRKPTVTLTKPAYGTFPKDVMISFRVSNPVIGVGLLESVPESTLLALADETDADGDGISGRMNVVFDMATKTRKAGRFGWKANNASLRHQNATAALSDMGLSSEMLPIDLCRKEQVECMDAARKAKPAEGFELTPEHVEQLLVYMQLIAVPHQRNPQLPEVKRGEAVFRDIGCAACHMPTLITAADAAIPELANQTIHPFTDLLLHDMGEGLADHRPDNLASGTEWRTAPLWGLGLVQKVNGHSFLLHDGRARNVAEAILWHGGEAEAAKEKFRTSPKAARDDLLAFLGSL